MRHIDNHPTQTTRMKRGTGQTFSPVVGATSLAALFGLGLAYIAYMRRYVLHDIPLTAALSGELRDCISAGGKLGYYSAKPTRRYRPLAATPSTTPLLFIHGVDIAASSYEMKPLYEHFAQERTVYALDLPGYGFSERGDRVYSPALYRDAINEFIANVLHGAPVDAVALSLGCEFLALAVERRPELFHSLTFISPTGMGSTGTTTHDSDTLLRLLCHPSWSQLIFDTLTSRAGLHIVLGQMQRQALDRGLERYAYVSSHQPQAQYAPFYYLAGRLFSSHIWQVYAALRQPVLMLYGQSHMTRYDRVDELHTKPNWRIAEFKKCGDLVHFDDPSGAILQLSRHLKV